MRERHSKMAGKRAFAKAKSQGVFGHPSGRTKTPLRAGLYARVSTNDQQTIPLQIRALREYAARRGWTVAMQVKEIGSGASARQLREKIVGAARRRDIEVGARNRKFLISWHHGVSSPDGWALSRSIDNRTRFPCISPGPVVGFSKHIL